MSAPWYREADGNRIQTDERQGNHMPPTIRRATVADAPVVVEFNRLLAEESEGKTLDPTKLLPGVRAGLEDPARSLYFLAEDGGQVLGQMAVTFEWSDWRNGWFWWVQSVYVVPAARRC